MSSIKSGIQNICKNTPLIFFLILENLGFFIKMVFMLTSNELITALPSHQGTLQSLRSSDKGTDFIQEALPSRPNHLPKAPLPNTIALGIRFPHTKCRGTQTSIPQQHTCVFSFLHTKHRALADPAPCFFDSMSSELFHIRIRRYAFFFFSLHITSL